MEAKFTWTLRTRKYPGRSQRWQQRFHLTDRITKIEIRINTIVHQNQSLKFGLFIFARNDLHIKHCPIAIMIIVNSRSTYRYLPAKSFTKFSNFVSGKIFFSYEFIVFCLTIHQEPEPEPKHRNFFGSGSATLCRKGPLDLGIRIF